MRGIWILVFAVGCQEYSFGEPVDPIDLPPLPSLPPTVVVTPDPPPPSTPPPGVAVEDVYANTADTLFIVDPVNGDRTEIGSFRTANGSPLGDGMTDIAINSAGIMYGGTTDTLYRIDAQTAEVEAQCVTDTPRQMYAMAFTPNDELVASGSDGVIRKYNVVTCFAEIVVDDPIYDTSGDLVGLPDGYLYWTVESDNADSLIRVDPNNWYLQYIGEIPYAGLFGLGYADGRLFGFSSDGITVTVETPGAPPASRVLDTTTIENDESIGWWGATTNPVAWPE